MYGLLLFVGLFRNDDDSWQEHRHGILALMLNACIPDAQREGLMAKLKEHQDSIWLQTGLKIAREVFRNTVVLGLGFAVHLFAAL